ncbi:tetratricopeptide repeat protein [Actinomadura oligospora]|uniref:tetratricopeptide repeat protein n=1 Tax=Actinomadura oligospora TaxID=111804 RepID=UPI0004B463EE|nr:tetratricopeptide repeat protein [Actinomadura oligospora]
MSHEIALANVLAHCGGDPVQAAHHLSRAIAAAPHDPEPYAAAAELMDEFGELPDDDARVAPVVAFRHFLDGRMDDAVLVLGSLGGVSPRFVWADAPWFGDERFLSQVSAEALCEGSPRLFDHGAEPGQVAAGPWLGAAQAVAGRPEAGSEDLARMAILLRAFGRPDESLALCDRADAQSRTVFTEVVRGGTWRALGNLDETAAAFARALDLEPDNWSLHLDLSDLHATRGDHGAALASAEEGLRHAPDEPKLRAARAAYRARFTRTPEALAEFEREASELGNGYRDWLRQQAEGGTA